MQWRLGFDIQGRYRALACFYKVVGWRAESQWTERAMRLLSNEKEKDAGGGGVIGLTTTSASSGQTEGDENCDSELEKEQGGRASKASKLS